MDTEDIKVIRPFGPTIAKVKIPENLVKELNDYTDSIISNDQKKKDLDWGKNLVGKKHVKSCNFPLMVSMQRWGGLQNNFLTTHG